MIGRPVRSNYVPRGPALDAGPRNALKAMAMAAAVAALATPPPFGSASLP
jgi:hypothetical protein